MSFSYLIRSLILLLPFYVSAEILRKKPLKENYYQPYETPVYASIIAIVFFAMMMAIHLANQIMNIDIISVKFGVLLLLMCVICSLYTIWSWHQGIE